MTDETTTAPEAPEPAEAPEAPAPDGELPEDFSIFATEQAPEGEQEAPQEAEAPEGEPAPAPEAEAAEPAPDAPEAATDRLQADLERRDRELLERAAAVRARERELQQFGQLQDLARTDPLQAAKLVGLDPMELAERYLSGGQAPEQPAAQQAPELAQLTEQVQALQQQIQSQQFEQAKASEHSRIRGAIEAGAEQFPMLNALAAEGDQVVGEVFQAAQAEYQQTGALPDFAKLLGGMEKRYSDTVFSSLQALRNLPQFSGKLREMLSATEKPAPPATEKPPTPATGSQTLSNALTGEASVERRDLTDDEADAAFAEMVRSGKLFVGD